MKARGDGVKYTTERVVNIIKSYHDTVKYINDILQERFKSVGVTQYGIDAIMPKSNNISNPTQKQMFDNLKALEHVTKKVSDIKYINDRLYRIVDERDAIIMYQLMSGKSQVDIARFLNISQSAVNQRIYKIAQQINGELVGYPQYA